MVVCGDCLVAVTNNGATSFVLDSGLMATAAWTKKFAGRHVDEVVCASNCGGDDLVVAAIHRNHYRVPIMFAMVMSAASLELRWVLPIDFVVDTVCIDQRGHLICSHEVHLTGGALLEIY